MSEQQQVNICQHNQTGFCKFRDKCQKKHENTLCENTENCGKAAAKDIQKCAEILATMESADTKKNVHTNMYRVRIRPTLMNKSNKVCSNMKWISNFLMKKLIH